MSSSTWVTMSATMFISKWSEDKWLAALRDASLKSGPEDLDIYSKSNLFFSNLLSQNLYCSVWVNDISNGLISLQIACHSVSCISNTYFATPSYSLRAMLVTLNIKNSLFPFISRLHLFYIGKG